MISENDNKQLAWESQIHQLKQITDALGFRIEDDIVETVCALNLLGFKTTGSCEGHANNRNITPWITIIADNPQTELLEDSIFAHNLFGTDGFFQSEIEKFNSKSNETNCRKVGRSHLRIL